MSKAVAVRPNVIEMAESAGMTREQIELFKRQKMPEKSTDDELALVLSFAREKNLSLLAGDVYAIRSGSRLAFCATIDGFRKIASRAGGIKFSKLEWTGDGRRWVDVWLKVDRKTKKEVPPAAARSLIETMAGAKYETVVRWSDFYAPSKSGKGAWERMGAHMLGKVAEAHGLRRAFPEALGQLYESSEMDQAKRQDASPPREVGRTDEERKAEREFQARWRHYRKLKERTGDRSPRPTRASLEDEISRLETQLELTEPEVIETVVESNEPTKQPGPKQLRYQVDQEERALLRKAGHNVPAQPEPKTAQEADTLHEDHLTQCVWKVHDRHKQRTREIAYFWSEPEMEKQDVMDWLHEHGHIGELGGDAKQVGEDGNRHKERMRWQVVKNLD
ncbi:MAG: recombinase RecT [Myxococcota bacterium]